MKNKKIKKIGTHGRSFQGVVVSDRMQKTVTVQWGRLKYLPKYERYMRKRTTVKAHNPSEINAREGDIVTITECRPLSKTKNFIVVKVHERKK